MLPLGWLRWNKSLNKINVTGVKTCLEFGFKVCEEAFEIPGTSSDPESKAALGGRINRQHRVSNTNS